MCISGIYIIFYSVNLSCLKKDFDCNFATVCNFGQGWEEGYATGVHTQYKALLRTEIKASVGVHIGLRAVNITLLGKYIQTRSRYNICNVSGRSHLFKIIYCIIFVPASTK